MPAQHTTARRRKSAPVPFKVLGLQRSGTNLMQVLMQKNFDVEYVPENATGWKHGPLTEASLWWNNMPSRYVLCVKNPYAWIVSCYRYFRRRDIVDPTMPTHFLRDCGMSFDEFATSTSYDFANPVDRWNFSNRCWLDTLPSDRTVVVRHEDMLHYQLDVMHTIEKHLHLQRQSPTLLTISHDVDVNTGSRGHFNGDYYANREYMRAYTPCLLQYVNQHIDQHLMELFHYIPESHGLTYRDVAGMRVTVRACSNDGSDAQRTLRDSYGLRQIRRFLRNRPTIIDFQSGIGAGVILETSLWPAAKVIACEWTPEHLRLLRINTATLDNIEIIPHKSHSIPGEAPLHSKIGTSENANEHATTLARIVNQLQQVELVRIGMSEGSERALQTLVESAAVRGINWICGEHVTPDSVANLLSNTHSLAFVEHDGATFFCARRRAC